MSRPSILVIDDEPDNFDVIEAFLNPQDYTLYYAASGENAIATLDLFNPDIVLLDVMMPGIDGMAVCRQIRAVEKWQALPIIMVTALSGKKDLARCLEAGANDFISKPVNAVELKARINSMLRIKQQYDQINHLVILRENTIAMLEQTLNELRKNLALTLSHELNTPLNGILGVIHLLKYDRSSLTSEEIEDLLDCAGESANRLDQLTQKFLLYLELELEASRTKKTSISTYFCPASIEAELMPYARKLGRDQDLKFHLTEAEIPLSEQNLLLLLKELVFNALKFSVKGQLTKVTSQVLGQNFQISIQDSGRGMTPQQIEKIGAFMQFERRQYEQQGLGMGLNLAKRIVELAGGTFQVESVYQQGTTVLLTFPLMHP